MKLYKANSCKEAAKMASRDRENWNEEERRQLELIIAGKELGNHLTFCRQFNLGTKTKRTVKLRQSKDCQSFVLEGEVYLFYNSTNGIGIEKLLWEPLSPFSDEQLINELCRRKWEYIVTEITEIDSDSMKV